MLLIALVIFASAYVFEFVLNPGSLVRMLAHHMSEIYCVNTFFMN